MLFDLRGGGRRRAIQAIYLTLAILMGGGLILFGIGGATSGGLVDAFKSNGGGTSSDTASKKQLADAEAKVQANRKSPEAWAQLARVRMVLATAGYNSDTGQFTEEGKAQLAKASAAWQRSLALDDKGDPNVARLMIQAYSTGGLNDPDETVRAMEVIIGARSSPSAELFGQYASYAYIAGQNRKGDLAADKAVALTPRRQRKAMRQQLADIKKQATQQRLNDSGATATTAGG